MEENSKKGWLYLLPAGVFLGLFLVYPLIDVFIYSVEEGFNFASQTYSGVGLYNFSYVLHDPYFLQAVKNTFILVIITVPLSTGLALLISLALSSVQKLKDLFQTLFFLPYVTNTLAVGLVFMILFKKTPYSDGLVNLVLSWFGIAAVDWLGQGNTAMAALCFVNIVRSVGYFLVIYYAAIMDIPRSYLEAAEVDGANRIQQFFHIILPNLKGTTNFVVVINTIWAFQIFDLAYSMTRGGPGYGTTTMIYRIYQEGFWNWKMGYACALAVMLFLMILTASGIIKRIFRTDD